jgi:hypothetical protein
MEGDRVPEYSSKSTFTELFFYSDLIVINFASLIIFFRMMRPTEYFVNFYFETLLVVSTDDVNYITLYSFTDDEETLSSSVLSV